MRKKLVCISLIVLLTCAVICASGGAAYASTAVTARDFDGNLKVFYDRPESVAAAQIDGCYMVIVGDRNIADRTASLVIYYDDGENSGVYRHALADEIIPLKLQVYQNYIFVYDDKNKNILIYEIVSPDQIESAGEISGYDDFSLFEDTLYLLSNYDVYMFLITEEGGNLTTEQQEHYSFAEKPSEITAIDGENFIAKLGADTIYIADMEGSAEALLSDARFYGLLNYHNGILYYYSDKTVYAYDIAEGETVAGMETGATEIPLSKDIVKISNIFADETGVYVADRDLKKVVRFNHILGYDDFVLCSFSGDLGRFNAPSSVSAVNGEITVTDSKRIQIFSGDDIYQYENLSFSPKFTFNSVRAVAISESGAIYLQNDEFSQPIAKPQSLTAVLDAKLDASGLIYILSENSLYVMNYLGQFAKLFDISGARKIAVNNKTRDIYVLTQDSVKVYRGSAVIGTIPLADITDEDVEFFAIETDFEGCIYLLCDDYSGDAAVVKYNGEDSEVYMLAGGIFDGAECLSIDFVTGDAYFVSKPAHAVYRIPKADLNVAVATDIPAVTLPSNPEDADQSHYGAEVIEIAGYPSTMFYPFNESAEGEDYYPQNLAYGGEIISLQSGVKLLSIYSGGGYRLAFYNGQLGFVLSDNTNRLDNGQPEFTLGETLFNTAVYAFPYYTHNAECDYIKFSIEKWETVEVLAVMPSYSQGENTWLYIEYDGERGYINASNVTSYIPQAHYNFVRGALTGGGQVNLYAGTEGGQAVRALDGGTQIKIYHYSGNYAYISAEIGGEEVFGYILKSAIAAENTFQKQKTGFLLLGGTIALGVIFLFLKKKFLT